MDGGEQSNNSNFSRCHFLIFVTADFHQCFFDMCSKKTVHMCTDMCSKEKKNHCKVKFYCHIQVLLHLSYLKTKEFKFHQY